MTRMITAAAIISFLSGCDGKTVFVTPQPFNFQKIEQPKERSIRVHEDDEELYKAYVKNFRSIIDFYNEQIDDYKRSFDVNNTGGRP